jgi:hypothetical protein
VGSSESTELPRTVVTGRGRAKNREGSRGAWVAPDRRQTHLNVVFVFVLMLACVDALTHPMDKVPDCIMKLCIIRTYLSYLI